MTSSPACCGAGGASSGWRSRRRRSGSASGRRSGSSPPTAATARRRPHARNGRHPRVPADRVRSAVRLAARAEALADRRCSSRSPGFPRSPGSPAGSPRRSSHREYIESAELLGLPRRRILASEILPNVTTPLLVEYGLRLTWSIALIAAISFLGFGIQPPHADWGLMINENRTILTVQPWAVIVPAVVHRPLRHRHELHHRGPGAGDRRRRPAGARPVKAIEVAGLRVELSPGGQEIVDGIAFTVERGEVVGLVGESGSGKTTVALALLGARTAGHAGRRRRGSSRGRGDARPRRGELSGCAAVDRIRPAGSGRRAEPGPHGRDAARRGDRLAPPGRDAAGDRGAGARSARRGRLAGRPALLRRYPHQLSGGQQQRVCIAMAFLLRPGAIVLDEPTTGLDVTTQAHVLATVRDLCREHEVGRCLRQPRPRRGREPRRAGARHVRRAPRRDRPDADALRSPGAPVHAQADRRDPGHRGQARPHGDPGARPGAWPAPAGCVFAPALPRVRPACAAAEPASRRARAGQRSPASGPASSSGRASIRRSGRRREAAAPVGGAARGQSDRGRPRRQPRAARGLLRAAAAGVPGARRGVGVGEDDARPGDRGPAPAAGGRDPPRRTSCCRPVCATATRRRGAASSTSSRARTPRSTRDTPSARSCGCRSRTSSG